MRVSIVDLRYRMNEVLKALDRNEKVTILYHGKAKGVIYPIGNKEKKKAADFSFCGMHSNMKKSVEQEMDELRNGRY